MEKVSKSGFDHLLDLDDRIIQVYNLVQRLRFRILGYEKKFSLTRNAELKNIHKGDRCFIVGNGPSIKEQDLTLLKDENTFFVNHFYNHPQISEINPKYYAIIDPKLITREWPLKMLNEVTSSCPGVTLLLNAKYLIDIPEIHSYIGAAKSVYWIYSDQFLHHGFHCSADLTKGIGSSTVVINCLFSAIYMGFSEIYLMGIDSDGIFRDLVQQSSHFYEAEPENIGNNDSKLIVKSLRSVIQSFRGWDAIADTFRNSEIKIINLTNGGLLNSFLRKSYEDVVKH